MGVGGPERGAIAQNGLNEAEVNLGVALYLWGFLKEAGANPLLTRTADTSLFRGEPFVLRSDLEARAEVALDEPRCSSHPQAKSTGDRLGCLASPLQR